MAKQDKLERAGEQALEQVGMYLREMVKNPRQGTILIEILGDKGQVRVKPTPYFTNKG